MVVARPLQLGHTLRCSHGPSTSQLRQNRMVLSNVTGKLWALSVIGTFASPTESGNCPVASASTKMAGMGKRTRLSIVADTSSTMSVTRGRRSGEMARSSVKSTV